MYRLNPALTPEKIKEKRKNYGLTQGQLGALLGYNYLTILRHERKIYPLTIRAARLYGIFFDRLECDEELRELVRKTDAQFLQQIREGIKGGLLPYNAKPSVLPSLQEADKLLDAVKTLIINSIDENTHQCNYKVQNLSPQREQAVAASRHDKSSQLLLPLSVTGRKPT